MTHTVPWTEGTWTNEPVEVRSAADGLHVTAREGSDAWRLTSYGFIHDTDHALLTELEPESALEVQFRLDLTEQFDQSGIFVRVDDETWIKAGVGLSDGQEGLGAVVTRGRSDWSSSPVPDWAGRLVTVRGSWSGDALTVRARGRRALAARPRRATGSGRTRRCRAVLLRTDPGGAHGPLHVVASDAARRPSAPRGLRHLRVLGPTRGHNYCGPSAKT